MLVIVIFTALAGCVEPFSIENKDNQQTLVVDGFISSDMKSHRVSLSRTAPINEKRFLPEEGAQVEIVDRDGLVVSLSEVKPGIYETNPMAGVVGQFYHLKITTEDGRKYESTDVELLNTPKIDSIYAEYRQSWPEGQNGIKIFVDVKDPAGATKYYRWEYIETYEIHSPFPSYFKWVGGNEVELRDPSIGICWPSDTLKDILVKSTESNENTEVNGFQLRFIPAESYMFQVKYSMLLRQYALSESAYLFWENLRVINETQGTLSDIQPGAVKGNIFSVTDPKETVLGYFDASVVAEKRVFFVPSDRKFYNAGYQVPSFQSGCQFIIPIQAPEAELGTYMKKYGDEMLIWDAFGFSPMATFELMPKWCCDCTNLGTNIRPSFWK